MSQGQFKQMGISLMKNEIKRELKSFGIITVLGLIGFSVMVIAAPWKHFEKSSDSSEALKKAEIVAYQVLQIRRDKLNYAERMTSGAGGGRIPASAEVTSADVRDTGIMSSDPWGQPYHYKILPSEDLKSTRILVWSAGPNQKTDTSILIDESRPVTKKPIFAGDDLGIVLTVYQN